MPKEKKEITKEVIEYVITPATIEAMKKQYSGMKITDAASDKAVRAARTFMVSQRTSVEKWRIEQNEEANDWRRRINQKAKEITALLLPIEESLQIEVKRVDDEKAKEKAEKEAKEKKRVDDIRTKISQIQNSVLSISILDLEQLRKLSQGLEDINITSDEYMEYESDAAKVISDSYDAVQDAIATRIKLDKEEEERKTENERLKEVAKKQKAAQAKIDEANKKIKADRKADEDRKKQEAFEKAATEKAQAAAAQKVKDDAKEKEEEEKAAEAEKAREESLRPDREKLIKFADKILDVELPTLKSHKANKILSDANNSLAELATDIRKQAKEL